MYLRLERFHTFAEGFRHRPLMVAEHGHLPIRSIVGEKFLRGGMVRLGQRVQLILQRFRSVVRSKDFRRQTFHQLAQVLIQSGRLKRQRSPRRNVTRRILTVSRSKRSSSAFLFSMNNFKFL